MPRGLCVYMVWCLCGTCLSERGCVLVYVQVCPTYVLGVHTHTNTCHDNPSQAVSTQLPTDMSILVLIYPGPWSFQATWKPYSHWTPPGAPPGLPT